VQKVSIDFCCFCGHLLQQPRDSHTAVKGTCKSHTPWRAAAATWSPEAGMGQTVWGNRTEQSRTDWAVDYRGEVGRAKRVFRVSHARAICDHGESWVIGVVRLVGTVC
jgi:hypothetical protein